MILLANANAKHIPLASDSVNCVVTSPPYYGLRDYGIGDQIGLEPTPDAYVENMVQVFREVWRVLRDDGTVWLNLGDSYASNGDRAGMRLGAHPKGCQCSYCTMPSKGLPTRVPDNLKPKDLIGIPWRVAFALQADGWWLRQDIIWHKPNPMPESVKDRCTKAHEYIFLLTKSARYWYDNEAVKESVSDVSIERSKYGWDCDRPSTKNASLGGEGIHTEQMGNRFVDPTGRNKRSVWTVTTKPYPGSHYAVFPPDLIEPCILAGCPETVCAKCGAPYERVTETHDVQKDKMSGSIKYPAINHNMGLMADHYKREITVGWQSTCDCNAGTKPGVVLDPFAGSGTTLMVARMHRRNAIGLDLNFKYLTTNARERLQYGGYVPVADGITQLTIGA